MLLHEKLAAFRLLLASNSPRRRELIDRRGTALCHGRAVRMRGALSGRSRLRCRRGLSIASEKQSPTPILLPRATYCLRPIRRWWPAMPFWANPPTRSMRAACWPGCRGANISSLRVSRCAAAQPGIPSPPRAACASPASARSRSTIMSTAIARWIRPVPTAFRSGSATSASSASRARSTTSWVCPYRPLCRELEKFISE